MTQIALTIAGSDSGGGAGIQADLKTFKRFGVFGTSVVTAVTAQNTLGVRAIHPVPPEIVTAQLAAVVEDLRPAALKTGMLATAVLAREVAMGIARYGLANYVLDPVIAATSGDRLLEPAAEDDMLERLVPLATLVTPNLAEAALLAGFPVTDAAAMERAGKQLIAGGAGAVLVKGGHLAGDELVDVLVTPQEVRRYQHRRIGTGSLHGTGCTLSAAITAGLALGRTLPDAVTTALEYVWRAIASAPGLGRGSTPLDGA